MTSLHLASEHGTVSSVDSLIKAESDLDAEYDSGETPLIVAVVIFGSLWQGKTFALLWAL